MIGEADGSVVNVKGHRFFERVVWDDLNIRKRLSPFLRHVCDGGIAHPFAIVDEPAATPDMSDDAGLGKASIAECMTPMDVGIDHGCHG